MSSTKTNPKKIPTKNSGTKRGSPAVKEDVKDEAKPDLRKTTVSLPLERKQKAEAPLPVVENKGDTPAPPPAVKEEAKLPAVAPAEESNKKANERVTINLLHRVSDETLKSLNGLGSVKVTHTGDAYVPHADARASRTVLRHYVEELIASNSRVLTVNVVRAVRKAFDRRVEKEGVVRHAFRQVETGTSSKVWFSEPTRDTDLDSILSDLGGASDEGIVSYIEDDLHNLREEDLLKLLKRGPIVAVLFNYTRGLNAGHSTGSCSGVSWALSARGEYRVDVSVEENQGTTPLRNVYRPWLSPGNHRLGSESITTRVVKSVGGMELLEIFISQCQDCTTVRPERVVIDSPVHFGNSARKQVTIWGDTRVEKLVREFYAGKSQAATTTSSAVNYVANKGQNLTEGTTEPRRAEIVNGLVAFYSQRALADKHLAGSVVFGGGLRGLWSQVVEWGSRDPDEVSLPGLVIRTGLEEVLMALLTVPLLWFGQFRAFLIAVSLVRAFVCWREKRSWYTILGVYILVVQACGACYFVDNWFLRPMDPMELFWSWRPLEAWVAAASLMYPTFGRLTGYDVVWIRYYYSLIATSFGLLALLFSAHMILNLWLYSKGLRPFCSFCGMHVFVKPCEPGRLTERCVRHYNPSIKPQHDRICTISGAGETRVLPESEIESLRDPACEVPKVHVNDVCMSNEAHPMWFSNCVHNWFASQKRLNIITRDAHPAYLELFERIWWTTVEERLSVAPTELMKELAVDWTEYVKGRPGPWVRDLTDALAELVDSGTTRNWDTVLLFVKGEWMWCANKLPRPICGKDKRLQAALGPFCNFVDRLTKLVFNGDHLYRAKGHPLLNGFRERIRVYYTAAMDDLEKGRLLEYADMHPLETFVFITGDDVFSPYGGSYFESDCNSFEGNQDGNALDLEVAINQRIARELAPEETFTHLEKLGGREFLETAINADYCRGDWFEDDEFHETKVTFRKYLKDRYTLKIVSHKGSRHSGSGFTSSSNSRVTGITSAIAAEGTLPKDYAKRLDQWFTAAGHSAEVLQHESATRGTYLGGIYLPVRIRDKINGQEIHTYLLVPKIGTIIRLFWSKKSYSRESVRSESYVPEYRKWVREVCIGLRHLSLLPIIGNLLCKVFELYGGGYLPDYAGPDVERERYKTHGTFESMSQCVVLPSAATYESLTDRYNVDVSHVAWEISEVTRLPISITGIFEQVDFSAEPPII